MPVTRPLPPLNALRAFEAAGRHLNFRVAADALGVTQGAVAQHVRGLEAQLGLRLFERTPRGLSFTAAGRSYHTQVAAAFDLLVDATATLRPEPSKVTISATPTFASKWLLPHLPEFTAAHPDIDLRILATEGLSSFRTDGIDLAIRQGVPPFGASLDAQLLFPHEVIAVAAPNLVQNGDLTGHVQLHDTHDLWPQFYRDVIGEPAPQQGKVLRVNQTSLGIEAALAGQGVALASRFLVARDLESGRLVQAVPGALRATRDFYLLARLPAHRSPAVEVALRWLLAQRNDP
mgnify:CR=1 FL=1